MNKSCICVLIVDISGGRGEWRYGQGGRWGMKVWSRGSLGNEDMVKGVAGE